MFKYESLATNAAAAVEELKEGWTANTGINIVKVLESLEQSSLRGYKFYTIIFDQYNLETGELITA